MRHVSALPAFFKEHIARREWRWLIKKKSFKIQGGLSRYLYLVPAAVIYITVIIVPSIYTFHTSFFRWNGVNPNKPFVGFQNYEILFTRDPTFRQAITNNFIWVLMTVIITVSVALGFALLINRPFRGRTFFRGSLYFPYVLSGIVVSITWIWVYQPQLGLLTSFTQAIGLGPFPIALLSNPNTALFSVYLASMWQTVGAPMILFLAGLQTIPKDLIEAARIDGAGVFQGFRFITIPMLRETFVIVIATQIINSMKVFDVLRGMTGGGPGTSTQTLAYYMVTQTFTYANYGLGSAIAVIMVLLMMIIVIPYVLHMSKN